MSELKIREESQRNFPKEGAFFKLVNLSLEKKIVITKEKKKTVSLFTKKTNVKSKVSVQSNGKRYFNKLLELSQLCSQVRRNSSKNTLCVNRNRTLQ